MAYASTRENAEWRAIQHAEKRREYLGWEPGILNGDGGKPWEMHWRTHERLVAEHDATHAAAWDCLAGEKPNTEIPNIQCILRHCKKPTEAGNGVIPKAVDGERKMGCWVGACLWLLLPMVVARHAVETNAG